MGATYCRITLLRIFKETTKMSDTTEKITVKDFKDAFKKSGNKFNARKVEIDGETFDSRKEGAQYLTFKAQMKASEPKDRVIKIECHVRYDITINEIAICSYELDFRITYADYSIKFYDVKGLKKGASYQIFRLKKRLMLACHGITITEV